MPYLTVNDTKVHYRDDGVGPNSLIFVHALGTSLRIWDTVVSQANSQFRCIRYDLRGHGKTDATSGAYSIEQLGADLLQFMDALEISRTVICGISIGGPVAQHVAASEPSRVSALILCDTAVKIGSRSQWEERIRMVETRGLVEIADDVMKRWFKEDFRGRRPDTYGELRSQLIATSRDGYVGACYALRDADLAVDIGKIDVPTLVLCGTDDVATPPDAARVLVSSIKGAQLSFIPNTGHLPCVEAPNRVAKSINRFLTETNLG